MSWIQVNITPSNILQKMLKSQKYIQNSLGFLAATGMNGLRKKYNVLFLINLGLFTTLD